MRIPVVALGLGILVSSSSSTRPNSLPGSLNSLDSGLARVAIAPPADASRISQATITTNPFAPFQQLVAYGDSGVLRVVALGSLLPAALVAGIVASLVKGLDIEEAAFLALVLGVLRAARASTMPTIAAARH